MNGGTAVDAGGTGAGRRPFERLAIVNRGEPAMRLVNAVREWNAEGRPSLRTIALYTAADRRAMFVREADEAVLIGPDTDGAATEMGPNPYLDLPGLARALRACRADAVWPGWGFVSERAEFAELCRDLGIVFVGPSPEVMRALGDKIGSKLLATRVGVPMAPWSGGPVADVAAARASAEEIGYPLMVKATAGGGGRGIRFVSRPEELDEAFTRASAEGARTAGDATVFLERACAAGGTSRCRSSPTRRATCGRWACATAPCSGATRRCSRSRPPSRSTPRRRICCARPRPSSSAPPGTSTPAPWSSSTTRASGSCRSSRSTRDCRWNTRSPRRPPASTSSSCSSTSRWAGGSPTSPRRTPPAHGHAIEARLTAEDPEQGFAPAPGLIEHLVLPGGPGVRVDTGVAAGDTIPPQFDSMIAKVIAWGRDRDEARAVSPARCARRPW